MDIEKLKTLKTIAKDKSILIVEDCNLLQKQIYTFLNKFFKVVYQSFDGEDGLAKYTAHKPDIILTDLSMPKKNGLEMIKEIKFINNKVKVIILSAHNEEDVLMDVIKLNIDSFLLKPLDIDSFLNILITTLGGNELNKYTECLHDLELIHKQKGHVHFVNYFKDMIIEQEGEILTIFDEIISIRIPHTQILAIDYEGNTILELKSIKKYMKFRLLNIDKENDIIHLSRPMYVEYHLQNSTHRQYFYNRKFSIGLHDHHKFFSLDVLDISYETITMYTSIDETELCEGDNVNITISLVFDETDEEQSKNIFARGKITSVSHYKKGLRVIANMEIDKKDQFHFKKYIKKIEDEIIKELTEI